MRVFVTGATGFIGTVIVQELIGAGHQVLGLARSEQSAQALRAAGADVHPGSLEDTDSLQRGAAAADGVIHAGYNHDFSAYAAAGETDRRAIEAIGEVLRGSGRPFVVTAGLGGLSTDGRLGTEADDLAPGPRQSEQTALTLAAAGVDARVIRLAPSVHGEGDYGFVPFLIKQARRTGVSAYVGEGQNRWGAVHRLDAARLFRLALEQGQAGARYHGVADEGIPMRTLAETIGRHLNVPVVGQTPAEAADHFGAMARFVAFDLAASSAWTQQQLNWHPSGPSLPDDLEQGHYFGL